MAFNDQALDAAMGEAQSSRQAIQAAAYDQDGDFDRHALTPSPIYII
jgi:hypothetical protein